MVMEQYYKPGTILGAFHTSSYLILREILVIISITIIILILLKKMRLRNFPGVTQRVDGKARIYLCTYLIHFMHTGL